MLRSMPILFRGSYPVVIYARELTACGTPPPATTTGFDWRQQHNEDKRSPTLAAHAIRGGSAGI